ncbi:hypothetical protein TNCV_2390831 [Trichonephila clavipes]|nr:hypothetical protein TNCV_2390831 [Trichonephila clavipes]
MTWSVAKSPRVAKQCDANIHSLTREMSHTFDLPKGPQIAFGNFTPSLGEHSGSIPTVWLLIRNSSVRSPLSFSFIRVVPGIADSEVHR